MAIQRFMTPSSNFFLELIKINKNKYDIFCENCVSSYQLDFEISHLL